MERSGGCTGRALYAITYTGRHVSFSGINAYPRPVQKPHPPFVIGGRSEGAYRGTARYAQGWYGFNINLERTRA
jgi:alkanesulfonate monooxygenase SsuD/methylene tetrahydromethanopterin reductase-like flavin-dependent oxidoreductase (luciferase family)